jgi:hypothetical protein
VDVIAVEQRVGGYGLLHVPCPPYVLGLSYILVAVWTTFLLKGFTFMSMCGMNQDLTSARILLSLSTYYPDTGTGS